ncbi:hypothetical protein KSP39_PZI018769 [Platanthera zijinensis]|uniref:Uncharacterized protein n=1 Tax=Platanthera zijinensis TaxID=2320716 RepID=A0AAP0B3M7_9ASPA
MQMCPQSINMRFSNQIHSSLMSESFASLLGFHHMQSSAQAMSLYAYGAQVAQQNQMAAIIKNNSMPSDGFTTRGGNLQNGKYAEVFRFRIDFFSEIIHRLLVFHLHQISLAHDLYGLQCLFGFGEVLSTLLL